MTYSAHNTDPHAASRRPSEEVKALEGTYATTSKTGKRRLVLTVTAHQLGMLKVVTSEGKVTWQFPSALRADLENGFVERLPSRRIDCAEAAGLHRLLGYAGICEHYAWASARVGREVRSFTELSPQETAQLRGEVRPHLAA